MKKLACLLFVLLIMAAPAWAGLNDLKTGFMGVRWGEPVPDSMAGEKQEMGKMLILVQHNADLGAIKVDQLQFFFYDNKFTQAIIVHKDLDALAQAITSLYGPPQVENNPYEPGMKNWQVYLNNEQYVSIGILPARQAAIVLHSGYLMRMLEGISQ